MGTEIERKFLVRQVPDVSTLEGDPIVQGYLRADPAGSVRIRLTGGGARLTVKGPTRGRSRAEFEYDIPAEDARQMLELCQGSLVEKVRYRLPHAGHVWELDVFSGRNEGLVVAEVELEEESVEPELPDWLGPEVTGDPRFYNASLSRSPVAEWRDALAELSARHAGGASASGSAGSGSP